MRLNTNSLKRTVAVLAAVCTLGTCCIAGSVAYADGANVGNIDATKKDKGTSITIHKYQGPETGTRSDGSNQSTTVNGKKEVKGVEFTLYKVTLTSGTSDDDKKIDLSTPEGWKRIEEIQKLDPKTKKAASFFEGSTPKFAKTKVKADTTGDDGSVKFDKLAESLYYVEETDTKGAQTKGDDGNWQPVTVTGKVDSFFITTPLPHKTANSWYWLYDVNVYPKNDISNDVPTKTPQTPSKFYVDKDGSTVIPWDISIPLMPPSDNKTYKQIGFVDSLPEGLTYKDVTNVKLVKKAKTGNTQATDVPLTVNTDYTVTPDTNNKKVTFSLSTARLTSLSADFGTNTYVLKVTLNTKVTKGTKNFTNFITGWIDDSKIGDGDENNPCVPTVDNPTKCDKNPHGTSHFATLKITKVNDAQEGKGKKVLKGAKFAIYSIKNDSTALNGVTTQNLATTTDPVKTGTNNDQLTIETGDDGTASVDLFISNDDKTTSKKYCLVETEAPAGFKKDETPHCYAVETETSTNVSATKPVADNNSKEIVNVQATEIDKILAALPMTGARGLVLLTAFGIVGLGGTLFYIITRRRKEQEEA